MLNLMKILINGIPQNCINGYKCELIENINFITMKWNKKLTDCYNMFASLNNIIDFDFSNLDTSCVTFMFGMFQSLNNIKVLDLSNFNTSSVKDMQSMFR